MTTRATTSDSETVCSNRPVSQWLASELLRRVTDTNNLRLLEPDITGGRVMGACAERFFQVEDSRLCGEWARGRLSRWS